MPRRLMPLAAALMLAACEKDPTGTVLRQFARNPCTGGDSVVLAENQAVRVDCGNGGNTVMLQGGGARYLIVPQFATDNAVRQFFNYQISSGEFQSAMLARGGGQAALSAGTGVLPPIRRPNLAQLAADRMLHARAHRSLLAGAMSRAALRAGAPASGIAAAPPSAGSYASFQVVSSFDSAAWATVRAQLAYVGANILLYIDSLTPQPGFTSAQLQSYGVYFDSTLYAIDTTAFGQPSDIDGNGRVIVLLSPVVNADTPKSLCSSGYVAGFFDPDDLIPSQPHSNRAEVFYSVVPDPNGTVSCVHTVADIDFDVPSVFMHELQHLINFSQHVVIGGGADGASWLDEGLSIVAEELGSIYYEQKCPPPSCRSNPAQLFPDSSQGFIQSMLYDSYQYALVPDTASIMLSADFEGGFSWRGGAWLISRWLADQFGNGVLKQLEKGPSGGIADIEFATGQSFPTLFANFGLSLYTDSLPGLPRATAPAVNRFVTRNVKQLWARRYATANGDPTVPTATPLRLFPITGDTSTAILVPGTMTFFRLDTPAALATVALRFKAPGTNPFSASLKPQLAIYRLPAGQ